MCKNKGEHAKRSLLRYQQIEEEISDKLDEIEDLKMRGNKLTASISDMPRASKSTPDNMAEKLVEALDEEQRRTREEIYNLQQEQFRIKSLIEEVNYPYKKVLYQRYIKNKSLYEISLALDRNQDYIRRMHGQALIEYYNIITECEI